MSKVRRAQLCLPAALGALALLGLVLGACDQPEPCGVPGVVATCSCAGAPGARVCRTDNAWSPCDCSGAIPLPNPVGSGGAVGSGGTGGATGTGGAGTGGSGGALTDSGSSSLPDGGEEDAGSEPGSGGSGGSGTGTGGQDAGTGGAPADPNAAYRGCMTAADCDPGADCATTASFPTNATVCLPPCVDVGECPVPDGSYEATVACVLSRCRIDCTPLLFSPLLSCPSGMTCIAPLFGAAYCHDDGT